MFFNCFENSSLVGGKLSTRYQFSPNFDTESDSNENRNDSNTDSSEPNGGSSDNIITTLDANNPNTDSSAHRKHSKRRQYKA